MYSTKQDAITQAIVPAIEAGDAKAAEYDVEQIADTVFEYSPELGGFVQIVDEAGFWAAVEAAAL